MSDSFLVACRIRESDHLRSGRPDGNVRHPQPAPPPLAPKEPSREPSALDLAALAASRNNSFNLGSPGSRNSSFNLGSPTSPSRRTARPHAVGVGAAATVLGAAAASVLGGGAATAGGPPPPRRIISYLNNAPQPPAPDQLPIASIGGVAAGVAAGARAASAFDGPRAAQHAAFDGARAMALLGGSAAASKGGTAGATPGGASLLFSIGPTSTFG